MIICGLPDWALGKKEAVLFSGDITSAFFLKVLLLLDVLPLFFGSLLATFLAAFFEVPDLTVTFFFRPS